MNEKEFNQLRKHIAAYAHQHGVEAHLSIDDVEGSDVTPPGQRIFMQVIRRVEGQPPREHPHNASGYRPDVPDLRARLERDVRDAALALHGPV